MITQQQIADVLGNPVWDSQGAKIGEAKRVFLDDHTGEPDWVSISSGLFNMSETFVPLRGARWAADHLEVPYGKDQVKDAPNVHVDDGGHLSAEEEQRLFTYYGLERTGGTARRTTTTGGTTGLAGTAAGVAGAAGAARNRTTGLESAAGDGTLADTTGRLVGANRETETTKKRGKVAQAGPDEMMTRSEEEMHVRVEQREAGRLRLHRYVDVEQVEQKIPLRHEEVRLEREPITRENIGRIRDIGQFGELEQEIVLHEERAVVETEVVPKEIVRLKIDEHVTEETVRGKIRKERIEAERDEWSGTKSGPEEGWTNRSDRKGGPERGC